LIFLDSSLLVKRYVEEPGSPRINKLFRDAGAIGVASLTYAEVFSAFPRRRRESTLTESQYKLVARQFDEDWAGMDVVALSAEVLKLARRLLERYTLRAADSIQLGSAQLMASFVPIEFGTADRGLAEAAQQEGLGLL